MKIYYKLTDQNMKTRTGYFNEFQWELNKTYQISELHRDKYAPLCTDSWFHVYTHPLLAILLNSIHASVKEPRLFRCVCGGFNKQAHDLKVGFTTVKLTSEMEIPEITLTQKIAFGILCAKKVCISKKWNIWATSWLKNIDRSAGAAWVAETAVAARAAAWADGAAARAARAAAWAARAAGAAWVAETAAAWAAWVAETAAAWAAKPDHRICTPLNLIDIARKSMQY